MSKIARILVCVAVAVALLSPVVALRVHASTLDLLGVGWNRSEVTVLIKASKAVSQAAVDDVVQAISDWSDAIAGITGAPTLSIVTGVKSADIVIQMKIGGGSVLGQTLPKTVSPFSCVLNSVRIQLSGKSFGQTFSDAGTRNVARHELGHALGLGHSDNPDDLMYAAAESSEIFGDVDVPISSCDIDGIDAIYPLPQDCTIPDAVTCSP